MIALVLSWAGGVITAIITQTIVRALTAERQTVDRERDLRVETENILRRMGMKREHLRVGIACGLGGVCVGDWYADRSLDVLDPCRYVRAVDLLNEQGYLELFPVLHLEEKQYRLSSMGERKARALLEAIDRIGS